MAKENEDTKTVQERAMVMMDEFKALKELDKDLTLKKLAEMVQKFDGFKAEELLDSVAKIKATQEQMVVQIRNRNNLIPGLPDAKEAKQFSMVKAAFGVKTNKWDDAGAEHEIIKQFSEKVKHVIGVESAAGYFVPDPVIADVIGPIYTRSVLIAMNPEFGTTRMSVLDGLTGGVVKVPQFKGGTVAFWIGENDPYIESMAKTGDMSLRPKKLTCLIRMSEETRKFTSYGYENLLRNDMQRAIAKKLDWSAFYGKGNENEPRGLISHEGITMFSAETGGVIDPAVGPPASALGGDMDFDKLSEMIGVAEDKDVQIDSSYATISSPRFFRKLKRIRLPENGVAGAGGYLLGAPLLPDARLRDQIGPFDRTNQISVKLLPGQNAGWTPNGAAVAKHTDVFTGNWSEAIFARWGAMEIISDDGTGPGFLRDQMYVKIRMFCDIGVRNPQSFVWAPDVKVF